MTRSSKRCTSLVGIAIFSLFALCGRGVHERKKYDCCDHTALLAACRQLISHPEMYAGSPSAIFPVPGPPDRGFILYLSRSKAAYGEEIPEILRRLSPDEIVVNADGTCVVNDPVVFPPMRNAIIAFSKDCDRQWGTRRYIDGLWRLDGRGS